MGSQWVGRDFAPSNSLLSAADVCLFLTEVAAHPLCYFRPVVSQPSADLPRFSAVADLDDPLIDSYSSRTRQPRHSSYDPWVTEDELRAEWELRKVRNTRCQPCGNQVSEAFGRCPPPSLVRG
uniref:MHC class I-like antigen recognition-like domain-containing protein n=1 Tax=Varanus komodoensis TaxID=61221 RepID=A0A8D2KSP4_VARKO